MKTLRQLSATTTILALLLLTGCSGSLKHMQLVESDAVQDSPSAGKSMVVFMRPSTLGFAVQSSVFNVTDGDPELVGLMPAKHKMAYELEPGKHLFMAIGESADFMHADLAANKTYYALVTPRMGAWKARFSLAPVKAAQLGGDEHENWLNSCQWIEKSDTSDQWAQTNMTSILAKQTKYYPAWLKKPEEDQPRLDPGDGR
jgi:hypothetical protein